MATIKTNDLKKGDVVKLRGGWLATIADNLKGNTRMATVYGHYTETGSVYAHDIEHRLVKSEEDAAEYGVQYQVVFGAKGPLTAGMWRIDPIELTDAQKKLRRNLEGGGW